MSAEKINPYNEQEHKTQQVSRMFNNIAKHYDFLNHFLSLGIDKSWRKRSIQKLQGRKVERLLDVATGTADLALEARKRLNVPEIVGVDISEQMLEVGRKKIAKRNWTAHIDLRTGNSEDLPFEDNSFDAITVAFGVRNFANLEKGLQEMYRVLRPGGKLVVLEFSRPKLFPFKQGYNFYFRNLLPFIGRVTSKDPKAYSYLYESVQAFPDGQDFLDVLEKIGLKSTQCEALTLGIASIYTGEK